MKNLLINVVLVTFLIGLTVSDDHSTLKVISSVIKPKEIGKVETPVQKQDSQVVKPVIQQTTTAKQVVTTTPSTTTTAPPTTSTTPATTTAKPVVKALSHQSIVQKEQKTALSNAKVGGMNSAYAVSPSQIILFALSVVSIILVF